MTDNIEQTATGFSSDQLIGYVAEGFHKKGVKNCTLTYDGSVVDDTQEVDTIKATFENYSSIKIQFWVASDGELHSDLDRVI